MIFSLNRNERFNESIIRSIKNNENIYIPLWRKFNLTNIHAAHTYENEFLISLKQGSAECFMKCLYAACKLSDFAENMFLSSCTCITHSA